MLINEASSSAKRDELLAEFNTRLSKVTGGALYARHMMRAPKQLIVYRTGTGKPETDDTEEVGDLHFGNFDVNINPEIIAMALRYYNHGFRDGAADIRARFNALMNPPD